MKSLTLESEIKEDHSLTVDVPQDFPTGRVRVTVTEVRTEKGERIRTFGDLIESEFSGMFADRDDLPLTNDEFRIWRRKLSERVRD